MGQIDPKQENLGLNVIQNRYPNKLDWTGQIVRGSTSRTIIIFGLGQIEPWRESGVKST